MDLKHRVLSQREMWAIAWAPRLFHRSSWEPATEVIMLDVVPHSEYSGTMITHSWDTPHISALLEKW